MNFQRACLTSFASLSLLYGAAAAQTDPIEPASVLDDLAEFDRSTFAEDVAKQYGEPTHSVPGLDNKLYNPDLANKLIKAERVAREAIANCDRATYDIALLHWHEALDSASLNWSDKFDQNANADSDSSLSEMATSDRFALRDALDKFPEFPSDCEDVEKKSERIERFDGALSDGADKSAYGASFSFGVRSERIDAQYKNLGEESGSDEPSYSGDRDYDNCQGGACDDEFERRLATFNADTPLTRTGGEVRFFLPDERRGDRPIEFLVRYTQGDANEYLDRIPAPTGSNARTLLPGPEGREDGASIGNTGGYSSEITDAELNIDSKAWTFSIAVPIFGSPPPFYDDAYVEADLVVSNRNIEWEKEFKAEIADYEGSFTYNTKMEQSVWDAHAAIAARLALAQELSVQLQATGGPSFYDLEGEDTLVFSFFNGATEGGGSSKADAESETKLTGNFTAELLFNPDGSDMQFGVNIGYGNDFVPFAVRNGEDPTSYRLEETEKFSFGATIATSF